MLLPWAGAESWVKLDMGSPTAGGGVQFFKVAVGDGDRDGLTEVYFTARQSGGIYEFSHDQGTGNWSITDIAPAGLIANDIAIGDGDDSGDKEIYVSGMVRQAQPRPQPGGRVGVFELYHDGSGWHEEELGTAGSSENAIALGDGNNDGRTELFSADSDGHIYEFSRSGNSWNMQDIGNSTASGGQNQNAMDDVVVGDGDNDGLNEVYGSAADGSVYRFSYTGSSWTMTVLGRGEASKAGSDMEGIVVGDADGDRQNEVYGASWVDGRIYMFKYDASASKWAKTQLVSLGSGVHALGLAAGDGNSDGADELYAGTSNNQVYKVFHDNGTGAWLSASVGSGNGPMNGVAVGSAVGSTDQYEVYAACQDGHGYQFVVDRTPPANPTVWSDTHPESGTWYANNIVHVLWKDVGSDLSGIDGYSYSWDNSPSTIPDDKKDVEESVHDATSPALSPGKWYFHIRARDNSLNWNASATHFGPICIGTAPDTTAPIISDVIVSGITDRLAVVSWSTNEPADSIVEYGTGTAYGQNGSDAGLVLAHSLRLTGLAPSTTYHFEVESTDASGNGPSTSGDLTFSTLATPDATPPVISDVKVSGVTDRVAVISWETDEPADSAVDYGVTAAHGSSASDGTFVKLHEVTLTGLNASTTYHFRVKSTDASGNGPATGQDLTFTTNGVPDLTPPGISNVRVEAITANATTVLWDTDEAADSFVEYGPTVSYGQSSADGTLTLHHSVTLRGLSADQQYHYRVQSADSSGNTGTGVDLTFRTAKTGGAQDTTPPVISGVTATGITDTRAVILWSTDELADSGVEYGNGTGYGLRTDDADHTTVHSVVLEGLEPSTVYHFRVESTDVFGNGPSVSGDLNFTTAKTPDTVAPVISGLKVTKITRTGATMTWTTNEPADSVVEYGNGTGYGQQAASRQYVLSHSVVLSGLSPGRVYHFRVNSTDPSGNAAQSASDKTFSTLNGSGTTTGSPFPWPWLVLAILLVAGTAFGTAAYLRRARRREVRQAKTSPAFGSPVAEGTPPVEEVETLEMDAGPQAETGDSWLDEGATAASLAAAAAPPRPVEPVPVRHIRCPRCRTRIPIFTDGPTRIVCPNCGTTGEYRPKGQGAADRVRDAGVATGGAAPTTRPMAAVAPSQVPIAEPAAPLTRPGPATPAGTASPVRMTRCSNCGTQVPIHTTAYPVRIICPSCGRTGIYRGPRA